MKMLIAAKIPARTRNFIFLCLVASVTQAFAQATTPQQLMQAYAAEAKVTPSASAGQKIFTSKGTSDWSCASCHGAPPTKMGKHAATGKSIEPLAPSANAARFTDRAKVEKWFRRNCKDVLSRECTGAEKAHVISYLLSVK